MSRTLKDSLNAANPNSLPDRLRQISLGDLLAGLIPRWVARTSLTSSATHIHTQPGAIMAVADDAGTTNLLIVQGTPGAGEVQISYDSNGLATLVFAAAVTGYKVKQQVLPSGLGALLALEANS